MSRWIVIAVLSLALWGCQQQDEPRPETASSHPTATSVEARPEPEPVPQRPPLGGPADIAAALSDPDRPATDRDRDGQRQPAQVLALVEPRQGMAVFDLFTGGGWYGEILSRAVGPEGEVWAHNPPQFYERFGSADLDSRLADFRLPNVTRHDRPVDDLGLQAGRFDLVVAGLVFHDLFWLTDDVPGVLEQLDRAMRPGGRFLITDHAAPEGTGASFAQEPDNKHRIAEEHVVGLMEAAGFELETRSDLLRNPEDDRTLAFFEPEMRGKPTDRFVLVFRKPG